MIINLNKFNVFLIFLCLILFTFYNAYAYNPQPMEDDFILPMPDNNIMVFRPVYIGEGDDLFALKKFKIGDPIGGFKETPTLVALGGSFLGVNKGYKDWFYYIGKYEVTEKQFLAISPKIKSEHHNSKEDGFPAVDLSWFEAMSFINLYNQWLYKNSINELPLFDDSIAFVRLPTEIEWEFAARGGTNVNKDKFDQKIPYEGDLFSYEWFSGPTSSHNKRKKTGTLLPNQLGIFDMLGNVAEITTSMYQIEYYQGRTGGFVSRGGHFLTAEKFIRSSLRTEEPFYIKTNNHDIITNKKPTMGFRIVLSSLIFSSRKISQELSTSWKEYRKTSGSSLPAAVSISPTMNQTLFKKDDAALHLQNLKNEIEKVKGIPNNIFREMAMLENSIDEIIFIQKQAEIDSAFAWTKIAGERGFFIYRELQKIPKIKNLISIARQSGRTAIAEKYKERENEIEKNIDQAIETYSDSIRQINKIQFEVAEKGFETYEKFLLSHKAVDQIRILLKVKNHSLEFRKKQRGDHSLWIKDFSTISK